jgi:DNA-binding CsgD family transcriptional regulator
LRLSAAVQHIQHLSALGLASEIAIPQMVDALQNIAPSRTTTFVWLDEQGAPTRFYERHPIPSAADAFMSQTATLLAQGEPNMISLGTAPLDFGNWWSFKAKPGWEMSVMRNELFRPYNIGNNMDFQIRDRGVARALLTINREPGSQPFKRTEIEAVLSLRGHFLHALTAPAEAPEPRDMVPDETIATAIFDSDGALVSTGPNADLLLYQLQSEAMPLRISCECAPLSVRSVLSRLYQAQNGILTAAPSLDVQTPWGPIRVAAHMLTEAKFAVVTLQRLEPKPVRRMRRLAKLDLSPRERRVALAMCETTSAATVARTNGLTEASFREYSKRIYGRLDVQGRDGVRILLDS